MTRAFADTRARPCPKKLPFKPLRLDRSIGNATGGHRSTARFSLSFLFFLRPSSTPTNLLSATFRMFGSRPRFLPGAHADRCRAARARSRLSDAEGAVSHRPPARGRRGARDDVAGGGRGAAAAEGRCVFRRVASARFLRRFSVDPRVEPVDRAFRPGRRRGASRRAVARARLDRRPERGRYRAGSDVAALGLTLGPPLPVPPRRAFIFPPRVPRYLRAQASSRTPLCACFEPSGVS